MNALVIFYDPRCGLCGKFREWLDAQPKFVKVRFVAHDSPEARTLFTGIATMGADRDLIVLADDGCWWQGSPAWLTSLWTTTRYRDWSRRLASPALQPFVKTAIHLLSENRLTLSHLMRLKADQEIVAEIEAQSAAICPNDVCPA